MPSRFADRLARIREAEKNRRSSPPVPPRTGQADVPPALARSGWKKAGHLLFERTVQVPFPSFPRALHEDMALFFPSSRQLFVSGAENVTRRLRFFDIETTGLSRGAGTYVFMIAAGRFRFRPDSDAPEFALTQLLLTDYPGEAEFLERAAVLLGGDEETVPVSFNGKCFDSQILKTRYLMNGVRPPRCLSETEPAFHFDLLYPCRRLWRTVLPSCRLCDIEKMLYGAGRPDDLPGSEAPEAWFRWLKTGFCDDVGRVGEHNSEDCISLVRIFEHLHAVVCNPAGAADIDYCALGVLYAGRNGKNIPDETSERRFAAGERLLRLAAQRGQPEASFLLALRLRSRGRWRDAEPLLCELAQREHPGALRLLAVDAEFRKKEYSLALSYAVRLASAENDASENTVRRIARLRRKLERSAT